MIRGWQQWLEKIEAELSPPDKALWEQVARGKSVVDGARPVTLRDFPARQVRLTREIVGDELRQLMALGK